MFVIRKALVFLNPILFIIGLEVVFRNKDYWWIALVVSIVLLLLTIWDFTKRKLNFRFLNFLLSPLLFLLISYWFIFFINTELYFRLIYSVVALFQLVLLDQVLNYFYFTIYRLYFKFGNDIQYLLESQDYLGQVKVVYFYCSIDFIRIILGGELSAF